MEAVVMATNGRGTWIRCAEHNVILIRNFGKHLSWKGRKMRACQVGAYLCSLLSANFELGRKWGTLVG